MLNAHKIILVNISIFIFIFLANLFFPLTGDDVIRLNMSILDNHSLLNQLNIDYNQLTGRFLAQLPEYIIFNKSVINISFIVSSLTSALCYVIFNHILYMCVFKSFPKIPSSFIIFSGLLIIFFIEINSFHEVLEQKTMTLQYFWGAVLMLIIIYKFDYIFHFRKFMANYLLYFVCGIILGTYNEILNLIFMVSLLYLTFLSKYQNKKNIRLAISFMAGLCIGFIFMIISPGTHVRKAKALQVLIHKGIYYSTYTKVMFPFKAYFAVKIKLFMLIIIILLMVIKFFRNKNFHVLNKENMFIVLFLFALCTLIPFAYYYEGWIGGRVTLVPDIILYIVLFRLLLQNFNFIAILNLLNFKALFITFNLAILLCLYSSYEEYQFNQNQIKNMTLSNNGKTIDFVFIPFKCNNDKFIDKFSVSQGMFVPDPSNWSNKVMADLFGVKSISEKSDCK